MIRRRFTLAALFAALFLLGWVVGHDGARADLYRQLDVMVEILDKVQTNYVDPVSSQKLIEGALRGVTKQLDPYSVYLPPKQYQQLQSLTEGQFGGIGIEVGIRDNYPTVISPMEGTPAFEAGLASGDILVKIDGKSSAGLTLQEVADRLRGPAGTRVAVTIHREGQSPDRDVTLERRIIVTPSVPYTFLAAPGVGYLRLADFSEQSGAQVRAGLDRLRAAGAHSLILDLRLNPGGLLSQAIDVAEEFVPKGTLIVSTRGRVADQNHRYFSASDHPLTQWPMVVLVDNGTASASEIVAGALQDLDRALIAGHTTYGKGLVQSVFKLRGGEAALKLTTARYYTPSGRSIQRAIVDSTADDEDDAEPAHPALADTAAAHALYRTAAGRRVRGGGGIAPDLEIEPDSLPALAQKIELQGLPFRFASHWTAAHPGARPPASGEQAWPEFTAFLHESKLQAPASELDAERGVLERLVRRELARRCCGDSAAAEVASETDPVVQRAVRILEQARTPRDVFAAAAASAAVPRRRTAGGR